MNLPTAPFLPVPVLFLSSVDSELQVFLEEAHCFVEAYPSLVGLIEADLDAHGRSKKELRLQDAQWVSDRNLPLAGVACSPSVVDPKRLVLAQGRPRTPGYVVLIALLMRGFFGAGFKSWDATTMLLESITLQVFFGNLHMKMPGRSTLTELVNAVTNSTRERILDAQIAYILALELDDFSTMYQDSTHVEGNTTWPTDSGTLVALVARVLRVGASLVRVHLPALESQRVQQALKAMKALDRQISMGTGKGDRARTRRRCYQKLLRRGRRVLDLLRAALVPVETALASLDVRPSHKMAATRAVERVHADLDALDKVMAHCDARVNHDKKIPASQKVLSLSDPDVGFIKKGQREPVVGYKPQIARSGGGFLVGLRLPQGNAADSEQLIPMLEEVIRRTGFVPRILSVDDGYSSKANVQAAKDRSIKVVSINGSKGRALTSDEDWNSDAYCDARNGRSGIESLMFTIKQGFDFGEVARRGLSAVYGELLEKAIAYNLCHVIRKRNAAQESQDKPSLAAA